MGAPKKSNSEKFSNQITKTNKYVVQQAQKAYKKKQLAPAPYQGKQVADQSPLTIQAQTQYQQLMDPTSRALEQQAKGYIGDVLSGKYLTQEAPGMQAIADRVRNQINAQAQLSGRYGSGSHDTAIANGLSDVYYQNYARERGLQDAASRFAPDLDAQQLVYLNAGNAAGLQNQQYRQALLDASKNKYYEKASRNKNALQSLASLTNNVSPVPETPRQGPLWASLLGGGISAGGQILANRGIGK